VRIWEELLERELAAPEFRRADHATPLYPQRVGTTFRRQVAVAQPVWFACGLKATEFVLYYVVLYCIIYIIVTKSHRASDLNGLFGLYKVKVKLYP
jgi:hypothetical protein